MYKLGTFFRGYVGTSSPKLDGILVGTWVRVSAFLVGTWVRLSLYMPPKMARQNDGHAAGGYCFPSLHPILYTHITSINSPLMWLSNHV